MNHRWLRRMGHILVFIGALLMTLIITAPAYWLEAPVRRLTNGQLQLINSQGTLWQGSAMLLISDNRQQKTLPDAISWTLKPAIQGMTFKPRLTVWQAQLSAPLGLAFTWPGQTFTWTSGDLQFPAQWLTALGAPWNTLKPAGQVRIGWQPGQSDQPIDLAIDWQNAQSALTQVNPLGDYHIAIHQQPSGSGTVQVSTARGTLHVEGQGQWSGAQESGAGKGRGGWSFNGYADASPADRLALTGLLSQMGRREGERYRLKF